MSRTTRDLHTGEQVGPVMFDYATSTRKAEELPEPRPRDLRTEFAFNSTVARVPQELRGNACAAVLSIHSEGCMDVVPPAQSGGARGVLSRLSNILLPRGLYRA